MISTITHQLKSVEILLPILLRCPKNNSDVSKSSILPIQLRLSWELPLHLDPLIIGNITTTNKFQSRLSFLLHIRFQTITTDIVEIWMSIFQHNAETTSRRLWEIKVQHFIWMILHKFIFKFKNHGTFVKGWVKNKVKKLTIWKLQIYSQIDKELNIFSNFEVVLSA